jgi:hypothetical protein
MATKTVERAMENMGHVRRLLGQKQPGFAAWLELAASQLVADLGSGKRAGAARPRPLTTAIKE